MIEVKNLTKRYGHHTAVDNISFTVNDGEIVGFLGPNGAGKTTTMNMMTGYISSTEGTVRINGYEILEQPLEAKRNIGYLPDMPPIYGDMLVDEYLSFVCDIKKVKKADQKKMLEEIYDIVKIADVSHRMIRNLSKGYRQRVGLAQALVGFPEVLILDEPTVGLDPRQIIEMRDVIKTLGERHTVILSSHILSEVSAVCDRVIIINKGKIVASDTTKSLADNMEGNKQIVRVRGDVEAIGELLGNNPNFAAVKPLGTFEDGTNDFEIEPVKGIDGREIIFKTFGQSDYPILMMKPVNLSLEEVFIQIVNGEYDAANNELEALEEENNIDEAVSEEAIEEVAEEAIEEVAQEAVEEVAEEVKEGGDEE